jgi:hypothetical protein
MALCWWQVPAYTPTMLKSYFTMAWRSFRRNKVTSFINVGGLMLGLTTGIIICLMVVYMFGFDKFHASYTSIHLLEMNQNFAGLRAVLLTTSISSNSKMILGWSSLQTSLR